MARRSSYETYLYWSNKYGSDNILKREQFEQARSLLKGELIEKGQTTRNLAMKVAQETSFTYSYKTGLAIRKAYNEMGIKTEQGSIKKISLREARNISRYDKEGKMIKDNEFWQAVSKLYKDKKRQLGPKGAGEYISTTIFGS